jgi:hypothetical protein
MNLVKIVSDEQRAVDRAALDAALAMGFPCGGWGRDELDITFRAGINLSVGPAGDSGGILALVRGGAMDV